MRWKTGIILTIGWTVQLIHVAGLRGAETPQRIALVIGNQDYQGDFAKLPSCRNDARRVAKWLQESGFDRVEPHLDVDRTTFIRLLDQLLADAKRTRPQQIVVYYSGHGIRVPDQDGDEKDDHLDEAFLCVNLPVKSPDSVLLRDDDFYRYLTELSFHTSELVIMLDTCHSGGLLRALPPEGAKLPPVKEAGIDQLRRLCETAKVPWKGFDVPQVVKEEPREKLAGAIRRASEESPHGLNDLKGLNPRANVIYMAAATQYEQACAGYDENDNSQFTKALLNVLTDETERGKLGRGVLTLDRLHERLTERLHYFHHTPVLATRENHGKSQPLWAGTFCDKLGVDAGRRRMSELFDAKFPRADTLSGRSGNFDWQLLLVDPKTRKLGPVGDAAPLASGAEIRLEVAPNEQATGDLFLYWVYLDPRGEAVVVKLDEDEHDVFFLRAQPAKAALLPRATLAPLRLSPEPGDEVATEHFCLIAATQPVAWLMPRELRELGELENRPLAHRLAAERQRQQQLDQLERILLRGDDNSLPDDPIVIPMVIEHRP